MALYMFYHFGPVEVSLDQEISFCDSKMTEVVVHLLEDSFIKVLRMAMAVYSLPFFPIYLV